MTPVLVDTAEEGGHSSETKTLKDRGHFDRVCRMKSYASTTVIWETLVKAAGVFLSSEILIDFIATIAVMVTILKYLELTPERIQLKNQASFTWNIIGTEGIGVK